jgi:hypothetical protein
MSRRSESAALAELQRLKASYQKRIQRDYEHAAENCATCPTRGVCCTDAHFVNVHITRLEAVHIRETLRQTPRLTEDEKRAVFQRARDAVRRYHLSASGDTFEQTFSCPLYIPRLGCLVHRRAKPAPCIQHACYENWEALPPQSLQSRVEHRVEKLNEEVYGREWEWLPLPLWLTLVDEQSSGQELRTLTRGWSVRVSRNESNRNHHARRKIFSLRNKKVRSLPVIN